MIIFAAYIQNATKNDQQKERRRLLRLKSETVPQWVRSHGTTTPGLPLHEGMTPKDRIKQLEQQKNKVAVDVYGQGIEWHVETDQDHSQGSTGKLGSP